jgi:chorismate dehydratase
MDQFTVGCVPYLNAKPLVRRFRDLGDRSPVHVVYDVPSRLPPLLEEEVAQAILVSSIEALRLPCRVADGVAIGSQGAVRSVRLFSKVPLDRITTLALDQSSMTTNALAQIVLADAYGVRPGVKLFPPVLSEMLADSDAGILIGDAGMRQSGENLHVLDLGDAWLELTGLPFVWAVWLGGEGLVPELAGLLRHAARWGRQHLEEIVPGAAEETGFTVSEARTYLAEVMDYDLGPRQKAGLAEFGRRLVAHGLLERTYEPSWVSEIGVTPAADLTRP